jgi:hypothetical protein
MQRKDIDDRVILAGIVVTCALKTRADPLPSPYGPWRSCLVWDLEAVLAGQPELVGRHDGERRQWVPRKLLIAKLAHMQRRGLIDGCTCGCRGDFEVTEKGMATGASWMPVVTKILE